MELKNTISCQEGLELTQKGILLVDVRETHEVEEVKYNVKNYKNIPLSELTSRYEEIPQNEWVIIACRSGQRSQRAIDYLKQLGFQKVTNLNGGILEWQENGFGVV